MKVQMKWQFFFFDILYIFIWFPPSFHHTTQNDWNGSRKSHSIPPFHFILSIPIEVVIWRGMMQKCITNYIIEVEYVVISKVAKKVVWLNNFSLDLNVIQILISFPMNISTIYCDNFGIVAKSKNHESIKSVNT